MDQLSLDQHHHLSIKDIGIILDRLSSKIVDVERLEREIERSDGDTHNWTIKATIRGEVMRELGVIYNSNYYAISEHPSYGGRRGSGLQDDDDDVEVLIFLLLLLSNCSKQRQAKDFKCGARVGQNYLLRMVIR